MKTWLIPSLFLLFLVSCVTRQKCMEKFGWKDYDSTTITNCIDTVHDTIPMPGISLSFDSASPCPPQVNYHKEVRNGDLTAIIDLKNGILTLTAKLDSTQKVVNRERITRATEHIKVEVREKEVPHTPIWKDVLCWANIPWLLIILTLANILRSKK